jgi:hypothetical protein
LIKKLISVTAATNTDDKKNFAMTAITNAGNLTNIRVVTARKNR